MTSSVSDAMIEAAIPIVDQGHETREQFVTAIYLAMEKAKEEVAAPSDRVTLAKHAIAEARIVLPKLIDHAVAHSELTDESPLIVRSLSAVHEIDAAFPRTTDMATGLPLPQNTEAADQSTADEIENLANEMLQRADELHRGGRIELACEMGKFSRKVRALSAIKPRQTTDDEIERKALEQIIIYAPEAGLGWRLDKIREIALSAIKGQHSEPIRNGDEGMGL